MDKFRIDSHKVMYHVDRLNDWLEGRAIYPVYMEISPAGACNHRCTYCALDFMEYQPRFLDAALLKTRLAEMGKCGVRSIMYAGEGEPFLHREFPAIVRATRSAGIDAAITSNGVLFDRAAAGEVLPHASWIKISINAATPGTYSRIHRTDPDDFGRVIRNMRFAASLRRAEKYPCALGMQLVLLPENRREVARLARLARDIGMDYLVVKPYSQHPSSKTKRYRAIKYRAHLGLAKELSRLNTKTFNVVFRINTMEKWDAGQRPYRHCLALPFWAYIDAGGDVWACSVYLGHRAFCLGNIYRQTFRGIWEAEKRRRLVRWAAGRLDTDTCRVNCRMDEVNRYLWELKHPPQHVNFI